MHDLFLGDAAQFPHYWFIQGLAPVAAVMPDFFVRCLLRYEAAASSNFNNGTIQQSAAHVSKKTINSVTKETDAIDGRLIEEEGKRLSWWLVG